jgi:hypothetical protein
MKFHQGARGLAPVPLSSFSGDPVEPLFSCFLFLDASWAFLGVSWSLLCLSWDPKVPNMGKNCAQNRSKVVPKSCLFGLGRKCDFEYLSHLESLLLSVQGTRKVKKIR